MSQDNDNKTDSLFKFLNSWVHLELVGGQSIPDDKLPFSRGSLIQIKKSPRPDKIPDNAIAMFIDYNWLTYKIIKSEFNIDSKEQVTSESIKKIQYRMKVLFDECVIELLNTEPEELGKNYVKISTENGISIGQGPSVLGIWSKESDS